ncbi:MAG: AAA family ATPase [Planctomycetes bacterium]|nr:AAA family ATPase [Planctomycetota bacterium]
MTDSSTAGAAPESDLEAVERIRAAYAQIRSEIGKAIVGQEQVLDLMLISVFARGHCLLIGVPGLAKTLMISTLARTMNLSFNRIQFTPDLMPSDITGTEVIQEDRATGARSFKFLRGPIFANVILADEINRTPPKTQAALLEAMQEHQVTAGGVKHVLEEPFFVLATQNPIEQEGTYPLPEAQLDRFMFDIRVDYPDADEELRIMQLTTTEHQADLEAVLAGPEILALQNLVRRVPVAEPILRYAIELTRMTRPGTPEAPDYVNDWVSWGAGPRATQYLILGGKARALLQGRFFVNTEDIRAVAHPVLRHRIVTTFSAEAEGIRPDTIVDRLIAAVDAAGRAALKERLPDAV